MTRNKDFPLMEDEANHLRLVKDRNLFINEPLLIDVGCNIGDFTDAFIKIFPTGKCILIDPSKEAISHCRNRFKDNKNVECFEFALGEREKVSRFYDAGIGTGCSSFYKRGIYSKIDISVQKKYYVEVRKYDDVFSDKKVFYLKLDAEGYEYNIIKGAKESLRKGLIKYIQFEYGLCMSDTGIKYSNPIPLLYSRYDIYDGHYNNIGKDYNKQPYMGVENFLAIRKDES